MTTLLVASTGGHLAELHDLVPRLGLTGNHAWATFDSEQSRSLLAGQEVFHVPPATTRDAAGVVRDYVAARRLLRSGRFTEVISTGASVAMSFFVPATAAGLPCTYIESATRTAGPSLTGRLAALLPGTTLHTQYPSWEGQRWQYGGSVFDGYAVRRLPAPRPINKVVVALGTHPKYGFGRLLSRLRPLLPQSAEILWQVGRTSVPDMPAGAVREVPFADMRQAMAEADVVITHAGVGSALVAMAAGKRAIYVPRLRQYGEHVDDHQVEIARELDRRGLVLARDADLITVEDLHLAAGWRVDRRNDVEPFRIGGRRPALVSTGSPDPAVVV